MGEKKEIKLISISNVLFIVALVIIVVMSLGIYKMFNRITELEENVAAKSNVKVENDKKEEINLLHFDSKKGKVVNSNVEKYTLISSLMLPNVDLQVKDDNAVFITVNSNEDNVFNEIDLKRKIGYEEKIDGFSTNVDEILLGILGVDTLENGIIVFLMEDGTVEYIGLKDALTTTDLKSRGKIEGLNNIVRVEIADAQFDYGGTLTVLAIDKDGNFYDLMNLVKLNDELPQ